MLDYANSSGTVNVLTPPFGSQFRWKTYTTANYNFGPGSIALSTPSFGGAWLSRCPAASMS